MLATIDHALLESIGPRDFTRDFHCVTTWSVVGLVWTGVPLAEVLVAAEIAQQDTEFVVVRSADQGRANFVWDDFDSSSIFVATHLNGQALDARTGGPLRLVAPDRYGYKSVKHLTSFDLRRDEPRLPAKEHLRARVALEERHPKISTRLLRYGYRAMIPPTAVAARRSMR